MEQNRIQRNFDGTPTIFDDVIKENFFFENTLSGMGTLIIDKDYINEMIDIAKQINVSNIISFYTDINNKVNNYFYNKNSDNFTREEIYDKYAQNDEDGMIIGTKMSDIKDKNVALCSEKTISAYIILNYLYLTGQTTRKPSMILSDLIVNEKDEPHAFLVLDKESDQYPMKHVLFDMQNPTFVEDESGNRNVFAGLYSLDDEERLDIDSGRYCTPKSLYEIIGKYHEIGVERTYGSIDRFKSR